MASSWLNTLSKVRKKSGNEKRINVIIMQPPGRNYGQEQSVYTGAGANGVVEPNKPVMADPKGPMGRPAVYHEGEVVNKGVDGVTNMVMPNNVTSKFVAPNTEAGQLNLSTLEQNGVKGYASGYIAPNAIGQSVSPLKVQSDNGQNVADLMNAAGTKGYSSLDPANPIPGVSDGKVSADINPSQYNQGSATGAPAAITPTLTPPTYSKIGATVYNDPAQPATISTIGQQQSTAQGINVGPLSPTTTVQGTSATVPQGIAPITTAQPPETATTPAETTEPPATSIYERGMDEGYAGIRDVARGKSELNQQIQDKYLNYLDATGAATNAATAQELRSQGYSEADIATMLQQQRRGQQVTRSETARDLAIDEKSRAEAAQQLMATFGLQAQQFEEEKRQYADSAEWTQYQEAIAAGDFETAANAYETLTGQRLSTEQLQKRQDYENAVMDSEMQRLEAQVGIDKLQNARDLADAGYDLDRINATLGTDLTQGQFDSVLDSTALGERNWTRKEAMFGTLLNMNTEESLTQAAELANEMIPGLSFDFAELITDVNATDLANVDNEMGNVIAEHGGKWEDVPESFKDNWAKTLGLDLENPEDAKKLNEWYEGKYTNSIDAQLNEFLESDVMQAYFAENPDAEQELRDGFIATSLGGFTTKMTNMYEVVGADGNTIETVDSIEEANALASGTEGATVNDLGPKLVPTNWSTGDEIPGVTTTGDGTTTTETTSTTSWGDMKGKISEDIVQNIGQYGGEVFSQVGITDPDEFVAWYDDRGYKTVEAIKATNDQGFLTNLKELGIGKSDATGEYATTNNITSGYEQDSVRHDLAVKKATERGIKPGEIVSYLNDGITILRQLSNTLISQDEITSLFGVDSGEEFDNTYQKYITAMKDKGYNEYEAKVLVDTIKTVHGNIGLQKHLLGYNGSLTESGEYAFWPSTANKYTGERELTPFLSNYY